MSIEKVFALTDSKITPVIGRYHTIHSKAGMADVEIVFLNKKYEWPNRVKEEVFRCSKCRSFILPKDQKAHKMICKPKKEIQNEINIQCTGTSVPINVV